MLASIFGQAPGLTPEIPYAGDIPLIPNVRPAVIVSGSDYDMGYQWYQQLVQIYGTKPLEERAHRTFTNEEKEALKAWQWYIKKYTPEMIDLMRGMVAGAKDAGIPLTYEEILAKWLEDRYIVPLENDRNFPPESRSEKLEIASCSECGGDHDCSGWAAWGKATKDGKLYCGGSGDHQIVMDGNEIHEFEYILVAMPKTGNNYVLSTSTGCCWHPAMNNKGVAKYHHGDTGYCDRYKKPEEQHYGYGVPNAMITMHTIRFANTALEAQNIVLSLPSGDGRIGGAWADVNGNAFVIENRDNPRLIRKPGDHGEVDFLYSTNNLWSKELKSCYNPPPGQIVEWIPHAGWLGTHGSLDSIGRNLELWNLFHNYHGSVDFRFAEMIWRFAGPALPFEKIEDAVADFNRNQGRNWNSHVSETGNAMVGLLVPHNGDKGLYCVSQGSMSRLTAPTYPGGIVVRLEPTYTNYHVQLERTPQRLASAARTRANYDMYNASQELRKLTYGDVKYAPLDRVLTQAVTEWQKAEYLMNSLKFRQGENVIANQIAKATRSYFRCQALSKHVQDALVPPPSRPEDLGLRPWFGAWGKWATRTSGEQPTLE
jgi:hypothetical protein